MPIKLWNPKIPIPFLILAIGYMAGCGGLKKAPERNLPAPEPEITNDSQEYPFASEERAEPVEKKRNHQDSLLTLLNQNPVPMPEVKKVDTSKKGLVLGSVLPDSTNHQEKHQATFRIQLLAVGDYEVAQAKKAELANRLGSGIEIVFDPPFYKLRMGWYKSRQKAEDRALELVEKGFQAFVVRQ